MALPPDDLRRLRHQETTQALAPLGTPKMLGFPDGALRDDAPLLAALCDLVADCAPDLIVSHPPEDYHPDHRALGQAVGQAAG